jgi:hypothetical protein
VPQIEALLGKVSPHAMSGRPPYSDSSPGAAPSTTSEAGICNAARPFKHEMYVVNRRARWATVDRVCV